MCRDLGSWRCRTSRQTPIADCVHFPTPALPFGGPEESRTISSPSTSISVLCWHARPGWCSGPTLCRPQGSKGCCPQGTDWRGPRMGHPPPEVTRGNAVVVALKPSKVRRPKVFEITRGGITYPQLGLGRRLEIALQSAEQKCRMRIPAPSRIDRGKAGWRGSGRHCCRHYWRREFFRGDRNSLGNLNRRLDHRIVAQWPDPFSTCRASGKLLSLES